MPSVRTNPIVKRMIVVWMTAFIAFALCLPIAAAASRTTDTTSATAELGPAVFVVPVKQTIESGLQAFLERAYREAEAANAERIILVINTLGGRVDTAESIGELIRSSPVPSVAFVENKAISAGAYIALNAGQIIMQPGSTIGAAAVVDGSGTLIENPKVVSYWAKTMQTAAELNGRDPSIAIKMVDQGAVLEREELGRTYGKGEILTLSAEEAVKVGYAEHIAGSVDETLEWLGLDKRAVIEINPSPAEVAARWITSGVVMTVLLILGIAGVAIELLIPGFGVPGIVGLLSFGLFFFGHYIAGFAGIESVVFFVIGVGLLVIELFVPSFGILGTLGILSLIAGVVTAAYDTGSAVKSLAIAVIVAAAVVLVFAFIFKKRGIWNRFILQERLTTEEGFVPAESKQLFAGKEGVTLTPLRPAGTIEIGDDRIDAVTSGEFIDSGRKVKVVKVEGTRVIVREIK
ncbi:nodulation protein NfeD [Paenibacillus tarimensis]